MAPFASKYSEKQRAAIRAAQCDAGMTAREAITAAAAGTLQEGLAPFKMPLATAQHFGRLERRKREEINLDTAPALARMGPDAARTRIVRDALTMVDQELRAAKRKRVGDPRRLAALREVVKTAGAVEQLARQGEKPTPSSTANGDGGAKPSGESDERQQAAELAAEAKTRARRTTPSRTPTPTPTNGDAAAQRAAPRNAEPGNSGMGEGAACAQDDDAEPTAAGVVDVNGQSSSSIPL